MSAPNGDEAYRDRVLNSFNHALNSHGYAFHYRVLNRAYELANSGQSTWMFEAAEFPVEVRGYGTRIDFVLKRFNQWQFSDAEFYLLAECKRANPSISNWCFVRAPYVRRNASSEYIMIERTDVDEHDEKLRYSYAVRTNWTDRAYHVAIDVKSNEKGDNIGSGRGSIEEAATQISRGLNGFVRAISERPHLLGRRKSTFILPVIFTTARLWVCETDLGSTDILTGNIDLRDSAFKEEPWVVLQYHMSPGLKHELRPQQIPHDLSETLAIEFIRSIPIVSSSGIDQFLRWASNFEF